MFQPALAQNAEAVADRKGFRLIVGHPDGRSARRLERFANLPAQIVLERRVEIGKRFVEQHQRGFVRQRPRQGNPLLLTAG